MFQDLKHFLIILLERGSGGEAPRRRMQGVWGKSPQRLAILWDLLTNNPFLGMLHLKFT